MGELVAAVLEEFDQWSDHNARQAAAMNPGDPLACAGFALEGQRSDIADHVQIRLAVVLASRGVES